MDALENKLREIAGEFELDGYAAIDGSQIVFRREFRDACAANACGKYGACWMCPPDCGDIEEMITTAKAFRRAFIFQTIGRLEDSFDIEGMLAAGKRHNQISRALSERVMPLLANGIRLGAGSCQICPSCARLEEQPCRNPQLAVASLESYGIDVSQLAASCGMNYINGENTVTYFGGFLYG